MTATPVAEPVGPARDRARSRSPADLAPDAPRVLTHVQRPEPGQKVTPLAGESMGGLVAQHANWDAAGGKVLLTGRAPFVDLTGHAGFRHDGSLDGTIELTARIAILGLRVGDCTWQVAGWSPEQPIPVPRVELRGSTLAVDLGTLPHEAALTTAEGLSTTRVGAQVTASLPGNALQPGEPLTARLQQAFHGLLGIDLGHLVVHRDADLGGAPAFVSSPDLFFAPGRYGAEDPTALKLLNDTLRAAMAGLVGAVGEVEPAPPVVPPIGETPPTADRADIPANEAGPPLAASDTVIADQARTSAPEPGLTVEVPAPDAAAALGAEAPPVQLIMPEAPTELTPAAAARGGGVAGAAGGAAQAATSLPSAEENVGDARGAVAEPAAETAARAQEALAAELGERPPPSPEIVALCARIRTAIRENRPEDEDKLLKTDPTQQARQAGGTITSSVQGQADQVAGSYQAMNSPPAGAPALTPTPVVAPNASSPDMGAAATQAAPDPIPAENLSLHADLAATDQRIADSGIDTRVTKEIPDGPFQETRDARGELGEAATTTPAELAAQQQQAIDSAQGDMAQLQLQAVAAMRAARSGTVGQVGARQDGMVGHEENTRESVSLRAQGIFDTTQRAVDALLEPLSRTAIARWEAGLTKLSQSFHDALARVQAWIDDRHSGIGGAILAIGDYIGGLPGWITKEYDRAEREFGDGVCDLLLSISTDVNGVIASAQALIKSAQRDIDTAFDAMAAEFPEWAAQEKARFTGLLDGLGQRVTQAQTSFVQDVSNRAIAAVNEAHAEVQAKRDEAGGMLGRIEGAIKEFADDPVKAIINGLLRLVGIPPSSFWALLEKISQVISDIADDPENFINNLVAGLKQGFQQFFDNFGTHVLHGFWDWLFSGLKTPIPMPKDFSAGSLFSFSLSLMGITWPKVREILVKHIGPTAVEVIEATWQLISVLIEKGPDGIVELIKEQLTPETIVQTILEAAVNYLVETLIQQVIVRVIGMLNPAGAIAQAIDLIYQVCSWVFRNAARIFRFVEAVVNGMADVVAGNTGGLANKVEQALASLIPPVIDFLAGLLHLGGLPGEIADVITQLQTMVLGVLDRVIGFLADKGRALLKKMGIGGKDKPSEGDDELGKVVRFSADGESHRVFVQTDGSKARLMVASTPTTIPAWIARWNAKLEEGKPAKTSPEGLQAIALLAQLGPAAAAADASASALVSGFEAAHTDPKNPKPPPDDSGVEAAETSIAGMLDQLFTLFGEDSKAHLQAIRGALPPAGEARTTALLEGWKATVIGVPRAKPINGGEAPVWDVGSFTASAVNPVDVLNSNTQQMALLPFFKTSPEPTVPSAAFAAYSLGEAASGHTVRTVFLRSLGGRVAAKMRGEALAAIGDTAAKETLGRIRLLSATDGTLENPFRQPVEILVKGMFKGGGFMNVLETLVQGPVAGVSYPEFVAGVGANPSTRKWLKDELLDLKPGHHEWLPRSLILPVMARAAELSAKKDFVNAVGWVRLLDSLRSPTNSVIFKPRVIWVTVKHSAGNVTESAIVEVSGHAGALAYHPSGRVSAGYSASRGRRGQERLVPHGALTRGTNRFHNELRAFFNKNAGSMTPAVWVDSLLAHLPTILYIGEDLGVPEEVWNEPVGVFVTLPSGVQAGDLTLRGFADYCRARWAEIQLDFQAAKDALP